MSSNNFGAQQQPQQHPSPRLSSRTASTGASSLPGSHTAASDGPTQPPPPPASQHRQQQHHHSKRLPPYISFDGKYDCFQFDFSSLTSSAFDFESVEAVGLARKRRGEEQSGDGSGVSAVLSSGGTSPQDVSAASLLHAAAPGTTAPAPSPNLTAADFLDATKFRPGGDNNYNKDKPSGLLQSPPISGIDANSFASATTLHHQDSISMFEASPLAHSSFGFSKGQPAEAGTAAAAIGQQQQQHQQTAQKKQQPTIAEMVRRLYHDLERLEKQPAMRFWLFRHSADEGVQLFVFTHLSDLIAWIVDKAPELTEPWVAAGHHSQQQQQQHRHHPEEEQQQHHEEGRRSHRRQRHHQHQHHHGEPTSAAGEDDDNAEEDVHPSRAETERGFDRNHTDDGDDDDDKEGVNAAAAAATINNASSGVSAGGGAVPPQHDEADRSSHSSSTVGTQDGDEDRPRYWLDIQTTDYDVLLEVLRTFPSLRRETFESFKSDLDPHRHSMRHFSHVGYLSCIFAMASVSEHDNAVSADGEFLLVDDEGLGHHGIGEDGGDHHHHHDASGAAEETLAAEARAMDKLPSLMQKQLQRDRELLKIPRRTRMCVVASTHVAISFHKEPVRGLAHVMKRIHMAFRPVEGNNNGGMTAAQRDSLSLASPRTAASGDDGRMMQARENMSPGYVLSMLYSQAVVHVIPDISALSHTIEQLDAKILLASAEGALLVEGVGESESNHSNKNNKNDLSAAAAAAAGASSSLIRRIKKWWAGSGRSVHEDTNPMIVRVARFRRSLAEHRANISRKEHLTSLLVSPKMLVCQYLTDPGTQQRLHDMLPVVQRTLQQLDTLRELLNQSNQNLMSQVSISQAQSSNKMASQMQSLSLVAMATMPLQLVAAAFGMNTPVPFQATSDYDSLAPFAVLVSIFAVWCLLSIIAVKWFQ